VDEVAASGEFLHHAVIHFLCPVWTKGDLTLALFFQLLD
jgi:hypothetical protein